MALAGVTHEFSMAIIVAHLSFTTAGEIIAQRNLELLTRPSNML